MKQASNQKLINRTARIPEEPCAGKPHAGICEGDVRQLTFLP